MTYDKMATMARFMSSRQGRTGSRSLSDIVRPLSHRIKAIQTVPDATSSVITYADFHGNHESASSKPATSDTVAISINRVPTTSSLARLADNDDLSSPDLDLDLDSGLTAEVRCLCFGNLVGMATSAETRAAAAIGALPPRQC